MANPDLSRARTMIPAFSGVQPDPSTAQTLALVGIGEILEQILVELRKQNAAQSGDPRMARRMRNRGEVYPGE